MSPAMDYSTKITERLVRLVLNDTIKVVIDQQFSKKKKKSDTGMFSLLYNGEK